MKTLICFILLTCSVFACGAEHPVIRKHHKDLIELDKRVKEVNSFWTTEPDTVKLYTGPLQIQEFKGLNTITIWDSLRVDTLIYTASKDTFEVVTRIDTTWCWDDNSWDKHICSIDTTLIGIVDTTAIPLLNKFIAKRAIPKQPLRMRIDTVKIDTVGYNSHLDTLFDWSTGGLFYDWRSDSVKVAHSIIESFVKGELYIDSLSVPICVYTTDTIYHLTPEQLELLGGK